MLYFDHNATAPMLDCARESWLRFSSAYFANPSSQHRVGDRCWQALDRARMQLAEILDCHALDIVWTSGATESNNTVFHHLGKAQPGKEVWISAIEHPSSLESARRWCLNRVKVLKCLDSGDLDLEQLQVDLEGATPKPACVAVMAANNETGIIQPWREILSICREHQVPFFCDAVQWIGRLPAQGLGRCDFLSGSAHKFGGPKGVGFIKCPSQPGLIPMLQGGPQQERRRAGTENTPGILAMVETLRWLEDRFHHPASLESKYSVRKEFVRNATAAIPGIQCLGNADSTLWNTVCMIMPEVDCRFRWVIKLDREGCAVSTGSACSSGTEKPSHVLKAMGFNHRQASRALRFSSGFMTSQEDWDQLLKALIRVYEQAGDGAKPI